MRRGSPDLPKKSEKGLVIFRTLRTIEQSTQLFDLIRFLLFHRDRTICVFDRTKGYFVVPMVYYCHAEQKQKKEKG
jgi:hypothetical protein